MYMMSTDLKKLPHVYTRAEGNSLSVFLNAQKAEKREKSRQPQANEWITCPDAQSVAAFFIAAINMWLPCDKA